MTDVGLDDLEVIEGSALSRVRVVTGLGQVARCEAVVVDDDERAAVQQRQADLERGRIKRHQHVRRIAGRRDRAAAEVDLVGRDAECRADRGPDFSRIIGESGKIGAGQGRGHRELRAHELDTVARVSRETDDDGVYIFVFIHKF